MLLQHLTGPVLLVLPSEATVAREGGVETHQGLERRNNIGGKNPDICKM